jgi:hypothetical protein
VRLKALYLRFYTTLEMLRQLKGSTETTTRLKRELLLDSADHLTSKLQARNYRESDLTDEVATLEFGLDEASDCVDNSIITLEMLRKLKDSTDTTTRRKRELLLDNADRLRSKLQARNYRESGSQTFESIGKSSTKPGESLKLLERLSSRIGEKFR